MENAGKEMKYGGETPSIFTWDVCAVQSLQTELLDFRYGNVGLAHVNGVPSKGQSNSSAYREGYTDQMLYKPAMRPQIVHSEHEHSYSE